MRQEWTIEKSGEVWYASNGRGVTIWADKREKLTAWLDGAKGCAGDSRD